MLSAQEVQDYASDGQITHGGKLSAATLTRLSDKVESFLATCPGVSPDYIPNLIEQDASWLEFATLPEILDVVAQVLGEDIILWGSALFCKSGKGGKATPWHQDGQYWPIRPLETCTVWIAFDPSTPENGCLRVIPGSHREKKTYLHEVDNSDALILNQILPDAESFGGAARDVILQPGMFSVHDAYLVHGAEANNSGRRRGGLTFRYMPASSYFDRDLGAQQVAELGVVDISQRQLHLVRGVDRCGRNDVFQG